LINGGNGFQTDFEEDPRIHFDQIIMATEVALVLLRTDGGTATGLPN